MKFNVVSAGGGTNGAAQNDQYATMSEIRFYGTLPVDYSGLQELYNAYKDIEQGNYTDLSWAEFQNALKDAENILTSQNADQSIVDSAKDALQKAYDGLEIIVVNKDALQEAVNVYEAAEQGNYTDESWSVFQDALQAAKDVLADEDAVQADVNAALTALNSAYEALEEKPEPEPDVDKDKLQEAVNIYGAIEQGDYTDESWGTFRDALQAAKDILADEDAVQEDVDNALEALNSAYEALEEKTEPEPGDEVDKDKLQTAVDGYKDTEQGSYTDESWEVFQNALQAAQTVLADPDASQEEVDGALIALNSAYAALEETKEPEKPVQPEKEPPTEHPTEEVKPKTAYNYEFDIEAIRSDLISLGCSMGLTHIATDDGTAITPDNASWATPVTASESFQGERLKRKLTDYVQSMPDIITAYGGAPIEYFTIYIEPLGSGSYRIYFLY